ncbi:phosphatidylserine decarboxylase family protein [Mariniphaga sediminis]|jgi:phosphatidylserine decarboxylase|uniref:Phosphatidylserine decarboxylase proenzyme n=1 Tax=Mariniphaga sediminis TaxID=1628158 RepID=A0A399D4Q8_9BACT|nr:phosphatidylserine decarboxylase family protein [Mariniphaga sediminis]RIH66895.1 phosphatidylserine decarboxylase family protein [Mariniphaga sediminis]
MQIHKEGKKIIPVAFFFLAVIDALIYFTLRDYLIFYFLMAGSLFLATLIVFFFRVPQREIEKNDQHILAPADGEIVEIFKVYEKEYFKDERLQVSIFMSVFNVHQNRAPVGGEVSYKHHKRGAYYPAFVKKSSEKNERCSTVFKMNNGTEVMARQIAGTVAQRIVTYKQPGDIVEQGQEYGFIRFGSRVDLFLPVDADVHVKMHQKTVGGKTVIASLK